MLYPAIPSLCIRVLQEMFGETKTVIRSRKSKGRKHNGQKFEDTKELIRSRKSKDRQHNGQKFEDTKE